MVAVAVRGEEDKQRVLVAVHPLADPRKCAREIGDAGDREFVERLLAADERDRAPRGGKALVEQAPHEAHFFQEYVAARIRREADEIGLRDPGATGRDGL